MRLSALAVLLAVKAFAIAEPDPAAFRQLVATRYPKASQLPAGVAPPTPNFDFVDSAKLPAGAKVLSAARATGGAIWVVTDQGAFAANGGKYEPLTLTPRTREPGQPIVPDDTRLVAVAADRLGQFWVATNKGLLVSDGRQWSQVLQRQDAVPYEDMTCLHLAANGDVWGGTTQGAWRLRDGAFCYFWGQRWMPGNHVRAVWSDSEGRTWLDTDRGAACIEEKEMTLRHKATHLDQLTQSRHNRRGFICEANFTVPGDPSKGYRFDASDNDGLWTAVYVGAMAFRYGATGDPAARRQARQSLDALLELERLTGTPGFPARSVVTDEELKAGVTGVNFEAKVHVAGETDKVWFRSPVDPRVWCKGDTSSDELDGHYFAWYVYHELVADAAEKAQIAAVVRRVTDHIIAHGFTLVGHTGRKTRWGIWSPELLNGDAACAEMRPLNSLEILTYLKIAEHITGDAKYGRAADELIQKHHYLLNTLLIRRGPAGQWAGINHSDDELLYLAYYPLLRLERNPDRRRVLLQSIARTWHGAPGEQGIRPEHSPLYNYIYGAVTGQRCDRDEAKRTLEDWPWDQADWAVQNRHRHDVQVKTLARGSRQRVELDRVLPASERRLARWNGNPWQADGGGDGRTEHDGAAWALAYWLGVYHKYLPNGD